MEPADTALQSVAEAESAGSISPSAAANIRRWLTEPPFASYRGLLIDEITAKKWRALDDAFYKVLEFGTGGRRGKMYPVGTNVLNARTIGESARGLADYVTSKKGPDSARSCVIARDTRHRSPEFAEICARVLVAAGFKVFLFPEPRSTPLLSSAVRFLKCDAGIMISASHNEPADNGFKCYAATGGQVVPPDDSGIINCVKAVSDRDIPEADFAAAVEDESIVLVGPDGDDKYLSAVVEQSVSDERDLSIVYTPMHGVGETSVAAALLRAGFSKLNVLASQKTPDGDFPNIPGHVSNPEIPATLAASIAEAKATGADLVLGSDPDADRIGVGIPVTGDPSGEWTTLDGNQIGALLSAFVIEQTKSAGKLRPDHYLVTTLVTGQMSRAIARKHGVRVEDNLLVGFKWIGQRIDEVGPSGFLFGFEESHGYLKGTYARDKDAAVASLLFAELAATVKRRGETVLGYLNGLYLQFGHFGERMLDKRMTGREGAEQIKQVMAAFRSAPPKSLGGLAVTETLDYQTHEIRHADGRITPLPSPSGDLVIFHLDADGTRVAARPSGTEPKIKFYLFARTDTSGITGAAGLAGTKQRTSQTLDAIAADIESFIQKVVG